MYIKKILCVILCLTLVVMMLTACGSASTPVSSDTAEDSAQVESAPAEAAPALLAAGARVVVDGTVHQMDIHARDGRWYLLADDMKTLFDEEFADSYIDVAAYAETADIRYTQDEALGAVYFNTWESYRGIDGDLTLFQNYITDMGLSTERLEQQTVSGAEMTELLDALVAYAAPETLEQWQTKYPAFRTAAQPITRLDAMAAIFLAAQHIGGSFSDLVYTVETVSMDVMELMRKDGDTPNMEQFGWDTFDLGNYGHDHCGIGALCYNIINFCVLDGSYPMAIDRGQNSFHMSDNVTYGDAMLAMLRVTAMRTGGMVTVDDPAAVTPGAAITPAHIAQAQAAPAFTAEDHPELQGFMGGMEYSDSTVSIPENIILTANWGFNAYCLKFNYTTLFDETAEHIKLNGFAYLDSMVAAAIENNVHLCLVATTLPGRWASHSTEDYTSLGEFDLFTNPAKQVMAGRVWQIIAARYKDIPSANLSFWFTFEPYNKNLSTGLPFQDYTKAQEAACIQTLTESVRAVDPDRMVIAEIEKADDVAVNSAAYLPVAEEVGNMQFMLDFAEYAFLYAGMNNEAGAHIDNNNHSLALPEYPTHYYVLDNFVEAADPLTLDGFLPAGTVVNMYLMYSEGMELEFYADDELIHSETVEAGQFQVGYPLSRYMSFAASDKMVSVTLPQKTAKLSIAPAGGQNFRWSGIQVVLPQEYAVEKWYDITPYDVFLGVEEQAGLTQRKTSEVLLSPYGGAGIRAATIHEDMTYTTPLPASECADTETMEQYFDSMQAVSDSWLVRIEDATFSAMLWDEVKEYYTDILNGLSSRSFSWFASEWDNITTQSPATLAGSTTVEYMGYRDFNLELLQLLQSFQQ